MQAHCHSQPGGSLQVEGASDQSLTICGMDPVGDEAGANPPDAAQDHLAKTVNVDPAKGELADPQCPDR